MTEESKKLSLRQKMAIKGIKWAEKIAVRKASIGIEKLHEQNKNFIDDIREKVADLIELNEEKNSGQIACMICSEIIAGFETQKEQNLVMEMIKKTLEEYNKIEKTPE